MLSDPQWWRVLGRGVLWLLTIAFVMQVSTHMALTAWLPTILVDTLGSSPATAGALAGIFQGVGIVGPFLAPLLIVLAGTIGYLIALVAAMVMAGRSTRP